MIEKWIHIKYDYVPKYYKECKLQGHNEKECYAIHTELYPKDDVEEEEEKKTQNKEKKTKEIIKRDTGKDKA